MFEFKKWSTEIGEKVGKLLYYAGYAHVTIRATDIKAVGISNQIYELKKLIIEQGEQLIELKKLLSRNEEA